MYFINEHLEQDEQTQEELSTTVESSTESEAVTEVTDNIQEVQTQEQSHRGKKGKFDRNKKWDKRDKRPRRQPEGKKEFEEKMLEVRRVTRVTTWGRQLSFRATMLIGNKNGKIGLGVAKSNDVQSAVAKATHDAYKNIVNVTMTADGTVPYPVFKKFKSAQIKLVPAKPGTGIKAWSSVRLVLELAWYTNILSKIVGTNNTLNNALLTIDMISKYKNFALRFAHKIKQEQSSEEVSQDVAE